MLASRDPASGDIDRAAAEMESVAALAGDAQAELRAVIDGLAPPEISEGGLALLRRYALLAGKAHGVQVRFAADDLPPLGADREAASYWIAQEALHNALRHSGAAEVAVSVCTAARKVTLEASDQGKGFVPELPPAAVACRRCGSGPRGRARRSQSAPHPGGRARRCGWSCRWTAVEQAAAVSAPGPEKITVLIADDHPVVRQGLRVLLSLQSDIEVVAEASDGTEAVELAAAVAPDVVLLDLKLPGLDGLGVLAELRDAASNAASWCSPAWPTPRR